MLPLLRSKPQVKLIFLFVKNNCSNYFTNIQLVEDAVAPLETDYLPPTEEQTLREYLPPAARRRLRFRRRYRIVKRQ